jgi:hypothetical protein
LLSRDGIDEVHWDVEDGSSLLVLEFEGFDAGEKLIFTIDVDEVEDVDENEGDVESLNEGIDPLTSGVEFQGSQLSADFVAPHYEDATASAKFLNRYDDLLSGTALELPPDDVDGKRDRTAGAVGEAEQQPRPIAIGGRVYEELDLDLVGDPGENGIAEVSLALWSKDGDTYVDTGHRATTDHEGNYRFRRELGLMPGTYQIRQFQPDNYFSVGARAGSVSGSPSGRSVPGDPDILTDIVIPLGDSEAVDYDFAEARAAEISGYVYHDRDDDGQRDLSIQEHGIGKVVVEVVAVDTIAKQATVTVSTDGEGFYRVVGLAPGTYQIVEPNQPAGYFDGKDQAGSVAGRAEGNAVNPGDRIEGVFLGGGQAGTEYNFGELLPVAIHGSVQLSGPDGRCFVVGRIGEPVRGASVLLRDAQGNLLEETTSDGQGRYQFTGLHPGSYTVMELTPESVFDGSARVGTVEGSPVGTVAAPGEIRGVELSSGQIGLDYDFCEEPPATISGFVFQDGPDIVLPPGEELPVVVQDLRDGILTQDDTKLAGVVLELRDGITAQAITGDRALPGMYAPGPIQTRTDANGYYVFRGLRRGNYSVYQRQPEGFIDGIDTAGTHLGVVFNPGEPVSPLILEQLEVDPKNDAIVRIAMPAGSISEQNNFSEIRVTQFLPPSQPPTQPPPPTVLPPPVGPQVNPARTPLVSPSQLPRSFEPFGGSSVPYTWHLSVVDAGQPRGAELAAQSPATVWLTGSRRFWPANKDSELRQGVWLIEPRDEVARGPAWRGAQFGLTGATPIAGDFNGDGVSEIGVFYRGQWFIDLNANGRWDEEDLWARLGNAQDLPVTGDWDGDGKDDIGIYGPVWPGDRRALDKEPGLPDNQNPPSDEPKNVPPKPEHATNGRRLMQLTSTGRTRADLIDHVFHYGVLGDVPVVGDWNGDGIYSIGAFRNGSWHFDVDGDGQWSVLDGTAQFGQKGDVPLVGDFNGDGVDEIGFFRAGVFYLDMNGNRQLDAHDKVFALGSADDRPVVGDWDGDGTDEVAVYRDHGPAKGAAVAKAARADRGVPSGNGTRTQ